MIKTETSATKFKEVAGSGSGMLCAMPNGCDSLDGGLPSSSVPGRPALQPVNVMAEENTRGRGAQAPGGSTVAERATKSSSLPKVELDLSVVHRPSCSALPPRSNASDFLPSGTVGNLVQGRYDTEFKEDPREIGRGGFGVVHKAMHYLSDVEFAVKKIRLTGNKKDIDTLVREVRTLAKLGSHANVVRYYNSWIEKSSEPIMQKTALALDTSGASFAKATVQVVGSPTEESDAVHDDNNVAVSSTAALGNSLELSLDSLDVSGCNMPHHSSTSFSSDECEFSWDRSASNQPAAELRTSSAASDDLAMTHRESRQRPEPAAAPHDNYILYLQMELCSSMTLEDSLKERKTVGVVGAVHILKQVLCALDWVHSHGIVHRDLKPSNLFISADGTVKLGDFGLAREVGDIDDTGFCNFGAGGKKAWDHTCGVGTHVYASPEQLSGRKITDRADMFSVGILIVELFHVFSTGMERVVTLSNARKGGLPPQFFVDHPRVASLALNCLSHDQLLRPTPSALLRALEGPTSATTITHIPSPAISHVPSPSISPQSGKLEEAWSIASTPHATAAASPVTSAMCTHWSKPGCEDDFTLGDRMQPTEEAVSAPGQQQGQGQGLASEASVQGSARAVNRSLDLANASANAASMARLEELEAQISELLRERAEKDKEIEELNRKVQWQAGLASALLCTPVEHMWGKNWKQWKKKVVGLSAPDHTG